MTLIKRALLTSILAVSFTPLASIACDAAGPMTHVGNVLSVDAGKMLFTIRDSQTSSPITFKANAEIIDGLKEAKGSVMVNYEEEGDKLTALGVTF